MYLILFPKVWILTQQVIAWIPLLILDTHKYTRNKNLEMNSLSVIVVYFPLGVHQYFPINIVIWILYLSYASYSIIIMHIYNI